jgi:hypothetical protein
MRDKYDTFLPRRRGACDEPTCCGPVTRKSKRTGQISRFCSPDCYRKYHKRALVRGARLYEIAMRWRGAPRSHQRGAKNPATIFGDVTWLLDEFLREDREMRDMAPIPKPLIQSEAYAALTA